MIRVTDTIELDENELEEAFIHSSGPGGQNVNKVATAVQLRFDASNSQTLTEEIKARLIRLAGKRSTSDGVIIIEAKRYRTREANRKDALDRLLALIRKSARRRTPRRPTKPSKASVERRVRIKKQRGRLKKLRGPVSKNE